MNNNYKDDDFVFKTATSPKLNSNAPDAPNFDTEPSINSVTEKLSMSSIDIDIPVNLDTNTNPRFPALDLFIAEKKKEIDSEFAKLSEERLENFLKREKEADELKEQELNTKLMNPITTNTLTNLASKNDLAAIAQEKQLAEEIDQKEEDMLKEMRQKAKETWKELEKDYQAGLEPMYTEQSARLSKESQLQESLKASGSIFDKDLFEKIVERCGKGRGTTYGKEKMARFWEVLDRCYPNDSNTLKSSHDKQDVDKLLAALMG